MTISIRNRHPGAGRDPFCNRLAAEAWIPTFVGMTIPPYIVSFRTTSSASGSDEVSPGDSIP
jgi:hypothetical protein